MEASGKSRAILKKTNKSKKCSKKTALSREREKEKEKGRIAVKQQHGSHTNYMDPTFSLFSIQKSKHPIKQ